MSDCSEIAESTKDPEEEENENFEENENDTAPAAKKPEVKIMKKKRKKKVKKTKQQTVNASGVKKKRDMKPPSPRISSKSTFAQIAKELKAKRLAQMAYAAAMAKKRKKNRVLRDEELYTDKDRAAAVNMGTRDIKQSLKMKKKLDKNDCQISEEAEPATLLALGNNELRNGDLKNALNFMNKALELNPEDKNGLVARSKCYLSLGDPQLALKDAETALQTDKTFVRAIFQKAEALYHLGDFEHSLMYYHRGHRLRPELECFRLGVQKAQEAIENTIGSTAGPKTKRSEKTVPYSNLSSAKTKDSTRSEKPSLADKSKNESDTKRSLSSLSSDKQTKSSQRRSRSAAPTVGNTSRRFLGELSADRLYLENLLKHPDLICSNQEAANVIKTQAEEGITFLKSRQEFWRQQKPNTSKNVKKADEAKVCLEFNKEN